MFRGSVQCVCVVTLQKTVRPADIRHSMFSPKLGVSCQKRALPKEAWLPHHPERNESGGQLFNPGFIPIPNRKQARTSFVRAPDIATDDITAWEQSASALSLALFLCLPPRTHDCITVGFA